MDDDRAGRALAGGLLVLVRPATVVGHRAPVEELRVAGGKSRIIHQDDGRLAAHIEPGVVVPVHGGLDDAVADEDHLAVGEHHFGRDALRPVHGVVGVLEEGLAPGAGDPQRGVGARRQLDKGNGLTKAAARARLEPGLAEFLFQVGDGLFFAGRGRTAALEFIGREDAHVPCVAIGLERRRDRARHAAGRQTRRETDENGKKSAWAATAHEEHLRQARIGENQYRVDQ